MSWRSLLKGDPVPWLLERSDSAVRAQTLRSLDIRGRWGGRAPYADRMPSRVAASKWITLQACTLLKHTFPEIAA
ncbi:MAG: hypothetical protein M3T56_18545 [Chloroflexota bacterium]|nr:hypothetical protein [Chloroflexota bacterium]